MKKMRIFSILCTMLLLLSTSVYADDAATEAWKKLNRQMDKISDIEMVGTMRMNMKMGNEAAESIAMKVGLKQIMLPNDEMEMEMIINVPELDLRMDTYYKDGNSYINMGDMVKFQQKTDTTQNGTSNFNVASMTKELLKDAKVIELDNGGVELIISSSDPTIWSSLMESVAATSDTDAEILETMNMQTFTYRFTTKPNGELDRIYMQTSIEMTDILGAAEMTEEDADLAELLDIDQDLSMKMEYEMDFKVLGIDRNLKIDFPKDLDSYLSMDGLYEIDTLSDPAA